MKAVDPKIKLIGPELSQWNSDISKTPKYPPTKTVTEATRLDYMTEFLKANGDMVDIVSVHRYPFYAPTDRTPITVDRMRQNTLEWEPMVVYLRGLVQQITGKDLPIAFTEVNSDSSNVFGTNTSPDFSTMPSGMLMYLVISSSRKYSWSISGCFPSALPAWD